MADSKQDTGLPRHKRLTQASEFSRVFRRPARRSDDCFSVAARHRNVCDAHGAPARLGLAISRKALPRAVDRNRVKRIVRESFRHLRLCPGIDFVVVARTGLRRADKAAMRASIDTHFDTLQRHLRAKRNGD
ncbi:ribonuclease P protein component [uncultured Thiohalocapsa sp.]|uniref:ribonuclease P protein component n=1 Tax=uncultured Thiohalocapsa sp. TaxID=768990 RepID=UPI0025F4C3DF|nr:ribonuclease P protein component [uncultured Thiohalocapsa sp.]